MPKLCWKGELLPFNPTKFYISNTLVRRNIMKQLIRKFPVVKLFNKFDSAKGI